MKKIVRLTESDIKRMVMEAVDAWEDSIYKKNQDQGFRNRYGIGQDWPHYDNEDYDNGIWQDDDGKCWTVYPGERQATCLDDEMNESRGLGYGLSDGEKRKVRDEHSDMRKHSHYTGRGVKGKPGEKSKKTYDIFKREGDKGNPWSKTLKKGGAADWVANMQDDKMNESVGRKTIRHTESELKNLIRESVKRVLNEEKYVFSCYIEGEGNYKTTVNDIRQLTPYIQKAKYWDISKGWNTSEPENLVAWGGEGGYWNNFLEKQDWAKEGVHWNKPSEKIAKLVLSKKKN